MCVAPKFVAAVVFPHAGSVDNRFLREMALVEVQSDTIQTRNFTDTLDCVSNTINSTCAHFMENCREELY